jgi:hypothetical protein
LFIRSFGEGTPLTKARAMSRASPPRLGGDQQRPWSKRRRTLHPPVRRHWRRLGWARAEGDGVATCLEVSGQPSRAAGAWWLEVVGWLVGPIHESFPSTRLCVPSCNADSQHSNMVVVSLSRRQRGQQLSGSLSVDLACNPSRLMAPHRLEDYTPEDIELASLLESDPDFREQATRSCWFRLTPSSRFLPKPLQLQPC